MRRFWVTLAYVWVAVFPLNYAQGQIFRSFTWDSNGVTNIVVPAAEVWEILTWGTRTTTVRGLDTLFTLPGGGFLSTTGGQYYTKQNKGDDTANPCG